MTLLLYLAAFVAVAIVAPLIGVLLSPLLIPLARAKRTLAPIILGLMGGLSVAAAMTLFVLIAQAAEREPSIWMFLVAFVPMLLNDVQRIQRAWTGETRIRSMVDSTGGSYHARQIALQEIGTTVGQTVGLWLVFLLQHAA